MHTLPLAKIDALIDKIDGRDTPGSVVAVYYKGEIVYQRAAGMSDLERNVPLTCESVFDIGSTGKQFTAMIIALLESRGRLSPSDEVRQYIAELPAYEYPVTVRHLFHHTSGLKDYVDLLFLSGRDLDNCYSEAEILELVCRQQSLNFRPGDEYLYSNTGYFLLGVIAERITGKTLRQLLHEMIFQPLGMESSDCNDDATRIIHNRAVSYRCGADGQYSIALSPSSGFGDGPVLTTVKDFFRWDQNFYNDRLGGGQNVIAKMLETVELNDGTKLNYALGLFIESYRGLRTIGHPGGWAGYRTDYLQFPDQRLAVIECSNQREPNALRLTTKIADILLDGVFPESEKEEATDCQGVVFTEDRIKKITGCYLNSQRGTIVEIIHAEGTYFLKIDGKSLKLEPVTPSSFKTVESTFTTFIELDADLPEPTLRVIQELGSPIPDEYKKTEAMTDGEPLQDYEGIYVSRELDAQFSISVQNGQLVLAAKFSKGERLGKISRDIFSSPSFDMRFTRKDSQVHGFAVSTQRAWNLPFERKLDTTSL
jgi:CubicO group peptidase (beta-lactamase class C family)